MWIDLEPNGTVSRCSTPYALRYVRISTCMHAIVGGPASLSTEHEGLLAS